MDSLETKRVKDLAFAMLLLFLMASAFSAWMGVMFFSRVELIGIFSILMVFFLIAAIAMSFMVG